MQPRLPTQNLNAFELALKGAGVSLKPISETTLTTLKFKTHQSVLFDKTSHLNTFTAAWIAEDRFYTKNILTEHHIPTSPGKVFRSTQKALAQEYSQELGFPVLLKVTSSQQFPQVQIEVLSDTQFSTKFDQFFSEVGIAKFLLVEKIASGNHYTILCLASGEFLALKRIQPTVTGDGAHSILELICAENARRLADKDHVLAEIQLDDLVFEFLDSQNIAMGDVIKKGKELIVSPSFEANKGASFQAVTEQTDPSLKTVIKNIHKAISGLELFSIEVVCQDIHQPFTQQNYVVLELNPAPSLPKFFSQNSEAVSTFLSSVVKKIQDSFQCI